MRVLLTGGSGFLGSNLIHALGSEGIFTVSVDLKPPVFSEPDKFILADVRDSPEVQRIMTHFRPDCVIHLAALATIQEASQKPELAREVNVEGTRSVMNAAEICGARVVFMSTDKVYGRLTGSAKYTEDSPLRPLAGSPYDESKAAADELVRSYFPRVRSVVLRLCNIYGAYDTHTVRIVPANVRRMLSGLPGRLNKYRDSSGEHNFYRDMLHVDDLCLVVLSVIHRPELFCGQAVNIGTAECCSMESVLNEISEASGCELSHEVCCSDLQNELAVQSLDISRAKELLAYSPSVSLKEGIARTVRWWREIL